MASVPNTSADSNPAEYADALDHLSAVATGNSNINTHPGLMAALASSSATPQDAQAINQYMAGVKAQNMALAARANGHPVTFTTDEKNAMNAMGYDYTSVDAEAQPAIAPIGPSGVAGAGTSSSPASAPAGAPQPKKSGGLWGKFRSFDKGLSNDLGKVLPSGHELLHNPVMDGITGAYNITSAAVAGGVDDVESVEQRLGITTERFGPDGALFLPSSESKHGAALHAQRAEQMKALGYDPNSVWSGLAFDSHGYSKTDVTPALKAWDDAGGEDKWGMDATEAMAAALQFQKDPKAAVADVAADTSLSPDDAARKMQMYSSPEFSALSKRLLADQATFGHQVAASAGLDPVKDATKYNVTAGVTDLVASFYIDPTMNVGRVVGAVRKVPLAIDSLRPTDSVVSFLDPAQATNGARKRVINGWQATIDASNNIREALAAGDHAAVAAEYAGVKARTPELLHLVPEFIGESQGKLRAAADDLGLGLSADTMATAKGEPITNLAEAAKWIGERGGMLRLMNGKAAVEGSYMPGAVSNWGYRAMKANAAAHNAAKAVVRDAADSAEWIAARNAGKLNTEDQAVVDASRAKADPALASHSTVDLKQIAKFPPTPEDGISLADDTIVAAPDAQLIGLHAREAAVRQAGQKDELASALRAAQAKTPHGGTWGDSLLPGEAGKIAYNKRRYGSAVASDGPAIGGWASPTAIAARARLAKARWSNLLPINNDFDLHAADTAKKVNQYAKFYLGDGQASLLAAQFAAGDLGTRKAVVQGLFDQVAHAAGLSKTDAGRELMKRASTESEAYTHVGEGWVINGKQVALHKGQTTPSLRLPSFKQIHDVSSKIGLYEGTIGRVGTSTAADNLFNLFRIGILLRPATATRNIIEPYAKAILDGQFGSVARARALTYSSSDQLAAIGEKLGVKELTGEVPAAVKQLAQKNLDDAVAAGSKHQIAVAKHTLNRVELGDISAMSGYGRTRIGSALSDNLAHMTRFYHTQLLRTMPEAELKYVDELYEVLPNMLHNFGQQVVAEGFSPKGATAIRDIQESGLAAKQITYDLSAGDHPLMERAATGAFGKHIRTGYGLETTDNSVGQARYINALHQRTYGSPETAKAAVAAARGDGDISEVIAALDKETAHATAYGQYFKPEDGAQPIRALTPDDVALGKRQWAQDVVNDYKYMLEQQDGSLNTKIADYISEHGLAPDEAWFGSNISKGELPARVLAPQYTAVATGGVQGMALALQDVTGRAFNQIVEGTIKRQSSAPFLASHYLKARAEQDALGAAGLLTKEGGISEESARQVLMGQAIRRAYLRSAQMIDDPGQKTQFDIVARNLMMFPRAMEAFIRRWGGSLAADPLKARKMMLTLEGAEHSGMIYRDQNGEETFTYPGSAVMRDAMAALSKIPGFSGIATFPVGMDMTGKVLQAAPGFNDPFRFSMSPMVNIPMRTVFHFFPEHATIWNEVDTALNGPIGASQSNQGILASVTPSAISKFMAAQSTDEKNSLFASAMVGAIAHLTAAGMAPGPDASDDEITRFQNQVRAQVRNQLYWRFAFGLVAPAAPSQLNENIDNASAKGDGSGTASDYAFHVQGIRNLSDEYKSILDSTSGDVARSSAIFTALHPEGQAYTVSTTHVGVNKAFLPATQESLGWMEKNLTFMKDYKSVGAYFMPKAEGKFDSAAYQAQMAMGIRQKKSISQFYDDVMVNQGTGEYYTNYDNYKAQHDAALLAGDKAKASALSTQFSAWKKGFLDLNLPLKAKFAESSTNIVTGEKQLNTLRSMIDRGDVPDGLGPQLDQMLTYFQQYSQWKSSVPAGTVGDAQKQAAAAAVDENLYGMAAADPRLTNIYNAVFRAVDNKLTKVGT